MRIVDVCRFSLMNSSCMCVKSLSGGQESVFLVWQYISTRKSLFFWCGNIFQHALNEQKHAA